MARAAWAAPATAASHRSGSFTLAATEVSRGRRPSARAREEVAKNEAVARRVLSAAFHEDARPENDVNVQQLGGGAVRVNGCHKTATYACVQNDPRLINGPLT